MQRSSIYDQAHLWVAGIRVYEHINNSAPSIKGLASFLKMSLESSTLISKKLEDLGVIRIVKAEFEERLYILEHFRIEELPRQDSSNDMEDEVGKFKQQQAQRLAEIEKKLGGSKMRSKIFSEIDKALKDPAKYPRKKNPLDDI